MLRINERQHVELCLSRRVRRAGFIKSFEQFFIGYLQLPDHGTRFTKRAQLLGIGRHKFGYFLLHLDESLLFGLCFSQHLFSRFTDLGRTGLLYLDTCNSVM